MMTYPLSTGYEEHLHGGIQSMGSNRPVVQELRVAPSAKGEEKIVVDNDGVSQDAKLIPETGRELEEVAKLPLYSPAPAL